jgi:aminoglycoside 6'-N-acetyltransferase I
MPKPGNRAANRLVIRFVTAKLNAATQRLRNRIKRMGASSIARIETTAVVIGMAVYLHSSYSFESLARERKTTGCVNLTIEDMAISRVRSAQDSDRNALAQMRALLWPDAGVDEHLRELGAILRNPMTGTLPTAILVSEDENGALIGFLEVGLRSHADGCDPARPVGFVEGWFVQEEFRNRGVGGELMRSAEDWARAQGCLEMASDALIDNEGSHRAHKALGFDVVDRCVHFRKGL